MKGFGWCTAAVLSAACAGSRPVPPPTPAAPAQLATEAIAADSLIGELIESLLQADARLQPAATITTQSVVVADGEPRVIPPFLAGVAAGGSASVTASRVEIHPTVAWATVEYRWIASTGAGARLGHATIIFTPNADLTGWWISHLHSSSRP